MNNSLYFTIFSMYGDINFDGILNVLDIVLVVDMVLNAGYNEIVDINLDGAVNVQDVVILVDNIINP